jgi:hypothetical protein
MLPEAEVPEAVPILIATTNNKAAESTLILFIQISP